VAKESIEVTPDASLGPQGLRVEHREMDAPPRILGKNIDSVRRQYEQNLARISTNLTIARREIDLLGESREDLKNVLNDLESALKTHTHPELSSIEKSLSHVTYTLSETQDQLKALGGEQENLSRNTESQFNEITRLILARDQESKRAEGNLFDQLLNYHQENRRAFEQLAHRLDWFHRLRLWIRSLFKAAKEKK